MRPSRQRQLEALEASYQELLLSALRECAEGRWGLFAHNEVALRRLSATLRSKLLSPTVGELLELGSKIERLCSKFALEPFPVHERLLRMRSSHDSNTPGEPKLARQWLEELT